VVGSGAANSGFLLDFANTVWRVVTLDIEAFRWDRIGRRLAEPPC